MVAKISVCDFVGTFKKDGNIQYVYCTRPVNKNTVIFCKSIKLTCTRKVGATTVDNFIVKSQIANCRLLVRTHDVGACTKKVHNR